MRLGIQTLNTLFEYIIVRVLFYKKKGSKQTLEFDKNTKKNVVTTTSSFGNLVAWNIVHHVRFYVDNETLVKNEVQTYVVAQSCFFSSFFIFFFFFLFFFFSLRCAKAFSHRHRRVSPFKELYLAPVRDNLFWKILSYTLMLSFSLV